MTVTTIIENHSTRLKDIKHGECFIFLFHEYKSYYMRCFRITEDDDDGNWLDVVNIETGELTKQEANLQVQKINIEVTVKE